MPYPEDFVPKTGNGSEIPVNLNSLREARKRAASDPDSLSSDDRAFLDRNTDVELPPAEESPDSQSHEGGQDA
jgi:hypothetical protein